MLSDEKGHSTLFYKSCFATIETQDEADFYSQRTDRNERSSFFTVKGMRLHQTKKCVLEMKVTKKLW